MRLLTLRELASECNVPVKTLRAYTQNRFCKTVQVGTHYDADHPAIVNYKIRQEEANGEPWQRTDKQVRQLELEIEMYDLEHGRQPNNNGDDDRVQHQPHDDHFDIGSDDYVPPAEIVASEQQKLIKYLDMPLRDVIKRFGSGATLQEWAKAVNVISQVDERMVKTDERSGKLIPREFVSTHMFSMVEKIFIRLLNESPKNIAARCYDECEAGTTVQELTAIVEKIISGELRTIKHDMKKAVVNAGKLRNVVLIPD